MASVRVQEEGDDGREGSASYLRVMHNSLSESDSEGTYSIILEPFALALALAKCSANPSPSP